MHANFDLNKIQDILHSYVEEMYPIEKSVFIPEPSKILRIGDCQITRRQIKHVVEQRKAEDKKRTGIRDLITAHLYSPKKMDLLKKKLNASAAGKTPHS